MRPLVSPLTAVILAASAVPGAFCLAKEQATVTVSYMLGPSRPMPAGLKAVAVIDAGVKTEGAPEDERERKWSAIAGDMVEAMLQNAGGQADSGLAVAKRSLTRQVLEEQDLRLAGLVEGDTAARAGKLLAVQGLVTSEIVIHIDVQKGSKSTLDWGGIMHGALQELGNSRDRDRNRDRQEVVVRPSPRNPRRPIVVAPADPRSRNVRAAPRRGLLYAPDYRPTRAARPPAAGSNGGALGGFTLKTREVEEISRSLTVQCKFSLVDAVTGRSILNHAPPPYQKTDSASPDFLFGGMVDQADLDPVDHFIGELVERATREFVGMLVPVRFEQTYTLTAAGKRGEAAMRALRADDYDTALRQLDAALREGKDDDGRMAFAMGVVCELTGDSARALKLYRQAVASPDVDKKVLPTYMAAKDRLNGHMTRIRATSAAEPPVEGTSASPLPGAPPGAIPSPAAPPPAPAGGRAPPLSAPGEVASPQSAPASSSAVQQEIRALKELEARDKK